MKAKTQINIGIVTAIFLIIASGFADFNKLNNDLYHKRRAFAMNAQLEAERQEAQRKYEKEQKNYKELMENGSSGITAPPIFETPVITVDKKIEEKFKQEAIEKVSYFSVVFQKSNIWPASILVMLVAYVYTAYRRYSSLNLSSFILLCLNYGLGVTLIIKRPLQLSNSQQIISVILLLLLVLLLAQSVFGISNLQKSKKI